MEDSKDRDLTATMRRLVDHVPSMLAYWDRDLRCRFANRAYERWFGVDPDRLIGTSIRDLLGPRLFELNRPYIEGALRGETQIFERELRSPDGITRHSLAHYQPDVEDGVVQGFMVTVTEVTPLKEAEVRLQATVQALEAEARRRRSVEQSLADEQAHLAVTLASIGAGFVAADREGRVSQLNEVAQDLLGWTLAEARGRPIWEVFVREGRPAELLSRNPVDVMLEEGMAATVAHQVVVVARDGTRHPLQAKAGVTYGSDGSVRGMAMVLRDLEPQQRAELDASRLAAIVESSQDAIIGKDLTGRITSWNAAAQTLFGWRMDEALGMPVQMLIPLDRRDEEMRILADLARGVGVPAFDTVRLHKDGRLVDVSVTISPIRDAQGRVVGGSKIARDVSVQRRAEAARLKAERLEVENREMQQASRLKSQFLANMSHELRTPLNAIIGFADLLQTGAVPPGSPKYATFLGHIGTSGRHLLQLINDVLDLSKVESGKFEFHPEPVFLPQLVKEVTDILHHGIQRQELMLEVAIDPAVQDLHLDPARLKQVLYNYLSNAIKFSRAGGRIAVRARPDGDVHVLIEVEDWGIGIAEADLPRLFVEFQQLDSSYSKQHQGTGLGLALTRRLVQAQGGTVGVRSELGRGSVFHARLNRLHGTDAAVTERSFARAQGAAQQVLVIEDDVALQRQITEALTQAGYLAQGSGERDTALESTRRVGFDGLTLDLLLAGQPGLQLLSEIRSPGPSEHTPVLAMSLPGAAGDAAAFAIEDILCKPIRSDEVVAAMARLPVRNQRPPRVLVIDDDPLALDLMRATLKAIGLEAMCLHDGRLALDEIDALRPDAIILDLVMPGFDGFEVLDALHGKPRWRGTPVFIWTSMLLTDAEVASLARSARAILGKGGGALASVLDRLRLWRPQAAGIVEDQGS